VYSASVYEGLAECLRVFKLLFYNYALNYKFKKSTPMSTGVKTFLRFFVIFIKTRF